MQKRAGKIFKRVLWGVLAILLVLTIIYGDLIGYGARQAIGQLKIVWNARPVEEVLNDSTFPDSLKTKLRLIAEVRQFAVDSLGLKDTRNYTTVYDQKGKEIMWVVTACEPFSFTPKEWRFPILGSVPYKGFFDSASAMALHQELTNTGWDASVRNPGGWSTLGWFTDPILSKMLERSEGEVASLIIHEMVHATIFVKDSVDFNENLATFIGDRGAEKFLIFKYGIESPQYTGYLQEDKEFMAYIDHMMRGIAKLDSLYTTLKYLGDIEEKRKQKHFLIQAIVKSLDTLSFGFLPQPSARFAERLPNNAYFMNIIRYQSKQDDFWKAFNEEFDGNLKHYVQYLTEKYPFL
jgi:predicted aminopeptidase